jgi:CheY-like chemotaxis protein
MEALGGSIQAESAAGEGSTFRMVMTAERARAPGPGGSGGRLGALLAEDNPTNRIVLSAMLTSLDFDVVAVETGAEALEAAGKRDFAVIVMDIQMPVMDGEEAIERIRGLEGPRGRTPIIVVTAHALAGDDRRYAAAGADRVLSKPVVLADLAGAIGSVLAQANA